MSKSETGMGNIRWIGGPPDAGKTTVAKLLAERHGVSWYRMDQFEMEHLRRADPVRHPRSADLLKRATRDEGKFFENWVQVRPQDQAVSARANWIERMDLICEDLRALGPGICIAEGPGFYPEAILPLIEHPSQAIWLLPSEQFKRESHVRREKSAWRTLTSDPERALANHIERDLILLAMYREELEATNLPWIEVREPDTAEAIADQVAAHFGLG